jgi:hypothetical protein
LHVLGLPPAFVLSQDQTLTFKEFNLDKLTAELTELTCRPAFPPARCSLKKNAASPISLSSHPHQGNSPQGHRRPRFSFSSLNLSKSSIFRCEEASTDEKPARADRSKFFTHSQEASAPPLQQRRDEPDLGSPPSPVNTREKLFSPLPTATRDASSRTSRPAQPARGGARI